MIVCLCRGVTCQTVRATIAGGAETVPEVARACGAGSDCGSCHAHLEAILGEELGRRSETHHLQVLQPTRAA